MKKIKIHKKVEEAAKEREERWRELRMIMEKNQGNDKKKLKIAQDEKKINEVDQVLEEIGLQKYSSLMKENGIDDLEILMEIQENHLEEIGIVLGHRLKILKKIREIKEGNKSPEINTLPIKSSAESPGRVTFTEPVKPKSILKSTANESPARESLKKSAHSPSPQVSKPEISKPSEKSNFISTAEIFASLESKKSPLSKTSSKETTSKPLLPKPSPKQGPFLIQTIEKPNISMKTQETFTDSNDLHSSESRSSNLGIKSTENSEKRLPKANPVQIQEDFSKLKEKEVVIHLNRPPVSSKPATVGKNLALFQPTSQETEKNMKISELITQPSENKAKEEIKWEGFSYIPYKPSEEIQAISQKSSLRPSSARTEGKNVEKNLDEGKNREKFDVAGWDN
jgi:hypothetical protein